MIYVATPDGLRVEASYASDMKATILALPAYAGRRMYESDLVLAYLDPIPVGAPVINAPVDFLTYAKSVRDGMLELSRVTVIDCPVKVKTNLETLTALTGYVAAGKEDGTIQTTLTSSQGDQVLNTTQIAACFKTVLRFRSGIFDAYALAKANLASASPTLKSTADIDAFYVPYAAR